MAAEEFDFPLDDVVEGDAAVVDGRSGHLCCGEVLLGVRDRPRRVREPTGAWVSSSATDEQDWDV